MILDAGCSLERHIGIGQHNAGGINQRDAEIGYHRKIADLPMKNGRVGVCFGFEKRQDGINAPGKLGDFLLREIGLCCKTRDDGKCRNGKQREKDVRKGYPGLNPFH
jgi:hypothetical protein